ncbi:MAG: hypothetical protein IPK16_01935 [Anaerolineales bacterium]|nr:hypothetical protein [Anaerolineales bacterium]
MLAFPAFWANGYGLTQIGSADLPLGSMVSTFNGLAWFWFVGLYVKHTWRLPERPAPVSRWDGGIALMLLASCGAVGLVATVLTGASNPFLQQLFLHLFLDLFAVGWFTLALLGVVWAWLGAQTGLPHQLPGTWLAVALASTFILGMSPAVVTPGLFWPAAVANLVAAALLSIHCYQLWRRRAYLGPLGILGLGALAVMILAAVIIVIPGVWSFGGSGQLRIFYLHDLLLGWVSTLLVIVIERRFAPAAKNSRRAVELLWGVGVVGMLLALLGLGVAPFIGISALFWLQLAAWCSVAVAAATLVLFGVVLAQLLRTPRQQQAILLPGSINPR